MVWSAYRRLSESLTKGQTHTELDTWKDTWMTPGPPEGSVPGRDGERRLLHPSPVHHTDRRSAPTPTGRPLSTRVPGPRVRGRRRCKKVVFWHHTFPDHGNTNYETFTRSDPLYVTKRTSLWCVNERVPVTVGKDVFVKQQYGSQLVKIMTRIKILRNLLTFRCIWNNWNQPLLISPSA